jgi:hypothetical protein
MDSNRVIRRKRRIVLLAVWCCVLLLTLGGATRIAAGQALPGEYDVKAAFVFNFLKFVEWPSSGTIEEMKIRVCIVGDIPVTAPFDELDNQEVVGKKLTMSHLTKLTSIRECQVLFIASSEERRLPAIMEAVKGTGTLTIGDAEGFARRGVIISFSLQGKKVRFEINAEAARRAGIKISSKLLKLASTVYGAAPAGER